MIRKAFAITALLVTGAHAYGTDGGVYLAENGLVIIEVESTQPADGWAEETQFEGYTFQSYYRWAGSNHWNNPGNGILAYRFETDAAGTWEFSLRNRHEHPDSTLENDCWVRVDGGTWYKVFSNGDQHVGIWTWMSMFDLHDGNVQASFDLDQGEHLIEISGRSTNFMIDRFHLHLPGHWDDPSKPESIARLGSIYCSPAVPNSSTRPAVIEAYGSTFVENNLLELQTTQLPLNQFGYLLTSRTQGFVANPGGSDGNLCLGGKIGRFTDKVMGSGSSGATSVTLDLSQFPVNPKEVLPGHTWNFTWWTRDSNPGPTSNFSDAVSITFQ